MEKFIIDAHSHLWLQQDTRQVPKPEEAPEAMQQWADASGKVFRILVEF